MSNGANNGSGLSVTKGEAAGIAILLAAVAAAVGVSWLKWPDPVIDFGREVYLPWRVSEGAVLYRDVAADYGPLSQWFNALVFHIAGPGMLHIVAVNLLLYAAILAFVYCEVRAGWGRVAAFAASLVFVMVFSFSQYAGVGNYNFATPYAHETTHGFLLVLALIAVCASWLRRPHWGKAAVAGALCGLCALLKAEVALAAALVALGAVARGFATRCGMRRDGAIFAACLLAPPLAATLAVWVSGGFTFGESFAHANTGWLGVFLSPAEIAGSPIRSSYLGTADAAASLRGVGLYGIASVMAACAVCALAWVAGRTGRIGIVLAVCLGVAAVFAGLRVPWLEAGRVLPAWLCLAAILALRPDGDSLSASVRWLVLLAAAGWLARMALNPRIYHYGYCQASLAAIVAVATAYRALPDAFRLAGRARCAWLLALSAFLVTGLVTLERISLRRYAFKTQPVGEGADRFYGFSPRADATAQLLEEARSTLAAKGDCRSLLVLPEGAFLNYLLRKPSPAPLLTFGLLPAQSRAAVLRGIANHPPDYVVLISRDLREYGVERFGDSPAHGKDLLAWIEANYRVESRTGADPFDPRQRALVVLRNRNL